MPRFVILEHDYPQRHWDLMLEAGEALRTWRLGDMPEPGRTVPAEALSDHRLMYLDYEGPVGGERGQVVRWDTGTYQGDLPGDSQPGDRIELVLQGKRLQGPAMLIRQEKDQWLFQGGSQE